MSDSLLFVFAWFCAGLVNNVAGFGAAMVAMPMVATSIPLAVAVPSSTLIVLTLNLQLGWQYRQHIRWRALRFLMVGGVFGTVAGLLVMQAVANDTLKLGMGILLAVYGAYSLLSGGGEADKSSVDERWGGVAGFFSTLLGALFGFNGPPLALFTSLSGWSQDAAKGVLGACFILTGFTIVAGQVIAGIHTQQTLQYYAMGCPAVLLGGGLGILASRFVRQVMYRKIVLVLILFAGLSITFSCI